jgi:hypothetical protein
MRSPQHKRRGGGGTMASPSKANASSRYGNEADEFDTRADLKLGGRKAPVRQDLSISPRKQQASHPQKKKVSKTPRSMFGRPQKKEFKSGAELLNALGAVADEDAQVAADALARDLELMGYDLDCETFITRGSSDVSVDEDRYAGTGEDISQKSLSTNGSRENRFAMDEVDEEEEEEERDEPDADEESAEDAEKEAINETMDEGVDDVTEVLEDAVSFDVEVRRGGVKGGGSKAESSNGSVKSAPTVSSSAKKSSSSRKEIAIKGNPTVRDTLAALPSKTNRSSKVVSKMKAGTAMRITLPLASAHKERNTSRASAPKARKEKASRTSSKSSKSDPKARKEKASRASNKSAKATSKPKTIPPTKKTAEEEDDDVDNVFIEGMSIFNEEGGVLVAPSVHVDLWDAEVVEEDRVQAIEEDRVQDIEEGRVQFAPETEMPEPPNPQRTPDQQRTPDPQRRSWLPFRRAASTRQQEAFQLDEMEWLNGQDEEQAEHDLGNKSVISQQTPVQTPAPAPAPTLAPAPAPTLARAPAPTLARAPPPVLTLAPAPEAFTFENTYPSGSGISDLPPDMLGPPISAKKNRPWLPLWNFGGESKHSAEALPPVQLEQSSQERDSLAETNSLQESQDKERPQLTASKPQGVAERKMSLLKSPNRKKDLVLSAIAEEGDSNPVISQPPNALFNFESEESDSDDDSKSEVIIASPEHTRKKFFSKKVIRVAVDSEKQKNSKKPFSRFRRNKKAAIELHAGTRRMDAIQENEEGFDVEVEMISATGTVGTVHQSVAQPKTQKVERTAETAKTPVPVLLPIMAMKKKAPVEGTVNSGAKPIYEPPSKFVRQGPYMATPYSPKLARTFSDFVEAIFAETPKAKKKTEETVDDYKPPPREPSISSSWANFMHEDDGPPRLILADTHLTDISPPEESPITQEERRLLQSQLRVVGVSQHQSLLDQGPPGAGPPKLSEPLKRAEVASQPDAKPVQTRKFFQRGARKTAASSKPKLKLNSKPKLNYPVGEINPKSHNKEPASKAQHRENTPDQMKPDSKWRTMGHAKQQKEIPAPAGAVHQAPTLARTIPVMRYPSGLSEPTAGPSLGLGQPTFFSNNAVQSDPSRTSFSAYQTLSAASSSGGNTWKEIRDASRIVGKAFKSVELATSDDTEDRFDTLMSMVSDDSSLGDVERALEVLKVHAARLGVRESDLLQSLKNDEDTILRLVNENRSDNKDTKDIRDIRDIRSDIKSDDASYISENLTNVMSGVTGVLSGEDESIRSLTLAEELMYAFQVYTGGITNRK